MNEILIVEDEEIIRSSLRRLLEKNGYSVNESGSVQEATDQFDLSTFDLIITDLRLPGKEGTHFLSLELDTPVLVMTSYASLKSAVTSMKLGAVDYIAKPFDHNELLESVRTTLAKSASSKKSGAAVGQPEDTSSLAEQLETNNGFAGIIGQCDAMQEIYRRIEKVAATDTTVLILGESGTGKELVAKALHDRSNRKKGPLISVNCAAIPETLIESELFGHEKGAFTGANTNRKGLVEAANGGTLFLDEIGELPAEAQARLLRLLQEKEIRKVGSVQSQTIDVRLVAATHRNLKQLAQEGSFREDLYYRLHVLEMGLPPLRERENDILILAEYFLKKLNAKKFGDQSIKFTTDAIEAIRSHNWPGNVRELENTIERALILCDEQLIDAKTMGLNQASEPASKATPTSNTQNTPTITESTAPEKAISEELSLEDYFQRFVLENQDQMTETEIAQKLGISRKCLWERRQRLGIPRKKASKSVS